MYVIMYLSSKVYHGAGVANDDMYCHLTSKWTRSQWTKYFAPLGLIIDRHCVECPEKGQMYDHFSLHWKLQSICDISLVKLPQWKISTTKSMSYYTQKNLDYHMQFSENVRIWFTYVCSILTGIDIELKNLL